VAGKSQVHSRARVSLACCAECDGYSRGAMTFLTSLPLAASQT
jgi:hypothetical protein